MLECLVAAIFFEARDQPLEGQFTVAEVVMNRVDSTHWHTNICDVDAKRKELQYKHDSNSEKPMK